MIRKSLAVIFVPFILSTYVHAEVTEREVGRSCMNIIKDEAESVRLAKKLDVQIQGVKKELLLLRGPYSAYNGDILVLLREPAKCELVLSTEARGVEFQHIKGKTFPDISTYVTEGKDADGIMITKDITYRWDGKRYKEK